MILDATVTAHKAGRRGPGQGPGCRRRHAHLPGQQPQRVDGPGSYQQVARAAVRRGRGGTGSARVRHRAGRVVRAAAVRPAGDHRVLGSAPPGARAGVRRTSCGAASTRRSGDVRIESWGSAPSAGSPPRPGPGSPPDALDAEQRRSSSWWPARPAWSGANLARSAEPRGHGFLPTAPAIFSRVGTLSCSPPPVLDIGQAGLQELEAAEEPQDLVPGPEVGLDRRTRRDRAQLIHRLRVAIAGELGEHQAAARAQAVAELGDYPSGLLGVRHQVQDRDAQDADWLAEIDQPGHLRMIQDHLRLPGCQPAPKPPCRRWPAALCCGRTPPGRSRHTLRGRPGRPAGRPRARSARSGTRCPGRSTA